MAQPKEQSHPNAESRRRKDQLIAELTRARSGMALHAGQVRYQADVNRRVKTTVNASLREHLGRWVAGAFLTGGFISMLPARQKTVYVNPLSKGGKEKLATKGRPAGFWGSFFRALVPLFKPILTAFITKQLASIVGGAKEAEVAAAQTTKAAAQTTKAAERTTRAAVQGV